MPLFLFFSEQTKMPTLVLQCAMRKLVRRCDFPVAFGFQISPCLSLWVIVRKYWVCPGTEINSLCISPQKNITSIRQRKTNDCQRNRQNSRNLSISHEMWWCLSVYCEEDISVLWSASFIHGKNVTCFFFIFSKLLCLPPQQRKSISLLCPVFFMVWCVTVIVVCSELRILLLCGSDLLESFCIPGLWNESDVRYNSF